MRRAATAVTAAITVALALPGASGASHRHGDEVLGAARNTFPGGGPNKLVVEAFSKASGAKPGGFTHAHGDFDGPGPMAPFQLRGEVTCLRVVGNRAALKYRFTTARGGFAAFKGGGVEVFVEDNGKPSHGKAVDRNAFDPPQVKGEFQATETQCDDPTVADYDPVDSGDYVVRDRRAASNPDASTRPAGAKAKGHRSAGS